MSLKITSRTRWRDKLEKIKEPKIVDVPVKWQKTYGTGKMAIARALDIDDLIRKTRKGKLVTIRQLREHLAKVYNVDHTCPLTTGIFIRIIAETAEEDLNNGKKAITPYWRVVNDKGELNPKFPGGVESQSANLKAEGHIIISRIGKKTPRIENFETKLTRF